MNNTIVGKCKELIERAERLKELSRKNIKTLSAFDALLAQFKL